MRLGRASARIVDSKGFPAEITYTVRDDGLHNLFWVVSEDSSATWTVSCTAGPPRCTFTGTSGGDVLRGTPGNDVICGLGGGDVIKGGGGEDIIFGGPGGDSIDVRDDAGGDIVYGEGGSDALRGDATDNLTQ